MRSLAARAATAGGAATAVASSRRNRRMRWSATATTPSAPSASAAAAAARAMSSGAAPAAGADVGATSGPPSTVPAAADLLAPAEEAAPRGAGGRYGDAAPVIARPSAAPVASVVAAVVVGGGITTASGAAGAGSRVVSVGRMGRRQHRRCDELEKREEPQAVDDGLTPDEAAGRPRGHREDTRGEGVRGDERQQRAHLPPVSRERRSTSCRRSRSSSADSRPALTRCVSRGVSEPSHSCSAVSRSRRATRSSRPMRAR